jgi:hypothetical protein
MPAATAITPIDRPRGNFQQLSFALTAGLITTLATEVETVAVPGVNLGDYVNVNPPAAGVGSGLVVTQARVSAAGVVTFHITNITAGSITPAAGTWTLTIIRGTTMVFAR